MRSNTTTDLACRARYRAALIGLICTALVACGSAPSNGTQSAAPASPATPAGCESLPRMSNTQKVLLGAAAGALAGALIGGKKHRVQGALGGALVGALAGSAFSSDIDVEEQADGSVKLKIPGSVMFASGQSSLGTPFQSTLSNVTTSIKKYCGLTVNVVGHTDNVGALNANMSLSAARARSVVAYMGSQGFDRARLRAEGRGPNEPIASNVDESGRQQNRRVEIFIKPPAG